MKLLVNGLDNSVEVANDDVDLDLRMDALSLDSDPINTPIDMVSVFITHTYIHIFLHLHVHALYTKHSNYCEILTANQTPPGTCIPSIPKNLYPCLYMCIA